VGWICIDSRSRSDALDTASGEVWRGRVWQPDRDRVRRWVRHDVARRADGEPAAVAVEDCAGWRYVVEEITAAGFEAHLAEPADTQAGAGRKRHAKTDRSDGRLLREWLQHGELPESWIPPSIVLEWRERVRLYKSLVDHGKCRDDRFCPRRGTRIQHWVPPHRSRDALRRALQTRRTSQSVSPRWRVRRLAEIVRLTGASPPERNCW
jgi:hypothetical protein